MRFLLIILVIACQNLFAQVLVNPSSTISCTQYYGTVNFTVTTGTPPYNFFISSGCAPAYSVVISNSNPSFTVSCYSSYTVTDINNTVIGTATHSVEYPANLIVNILPNVDTICKGTVINLHPDYASVPVQPGLTYTVGSPNWTNLANTPMMNSPTVAVAPGHSLTYSMVAFFQNSKGRFCGVLGQKTIHVKDCNIDSTMAIPSSCAAHDSIIKKYEPDAARLTIRNLIRRNSGYVDSIKLKRDVYTKYLNALIAVYNATSITATDTITKFPGYEVHTRPSPEHTNNYTPVKADSNLTWMKNLRNNVIPTGDVAVDGLISKYHLQRSGYTTSNNTYSYHTVYFKTDTSINMIALEKKFIQIPGCSGGYDQYFYYDTHDIMDTATSDPHFTEIEYIFKWGDCLSGCTGKRIWTFRVYHDCKVQYMGSRGDPFGLVGIKENLLGLNSFLAYPNPASNKLYLKHAEIEKGEIIITNQLGQTVLFQPYSDEIDISTFAKGIYFLSVKGSDRRGVKFAKE